MTPVSFLRACRFALQNFWRNIWLSVVTIVILVLTLFSITLSSGMNLVARQGVQLVKSKIDVSVYFKPSALEEDVKKLAATLSAMPQVQSVTYISREEALQQFKQKNAANPIIQETLNVLGGNPLGSSVILKAKDINDFPTIIDALDKPEYAAIIQDKDFAENERVITRLSQLTDRIRDIGLLVSALFSIIAALVIFNTIRITIYTYREEIGIMKLVGATNAFIRAPFIIESVFYALIAGVITLLLIVPLVGLSAPFVNNFFAGYGFDLLTYFGAHALQLFGLQILIGIVLSVISSMIAITRYLRM